MRPVNTVAQLFKLLSALVVVCRKSNSGRHRFAGFPRETAACKFCGQKRQ